MRQLCSILFFVLLSHFTLGQVNTGSIEGKILDETGEAIPFCNIELKQNNTAVKSSKSDISGNFRFVNLKPGLYNYVISNVGHDHQKNSILISPGSNKKIIVNMQRSSSARIQVIIVCGTCKEKYKGRGRMIEGELKLFNVQDHKCAITACVLP